MPLIHHSKELAVWIFRLYPIRIVKICPSRFLSDGFHVISYSSNGQFNADIFRGQMGLSSEEQKKFLELRLQLNGETNMESNNKEVAGKQLNGDNITACRSQVDVMSCCQENGDTCCQNTQSTVFPEKIDNPDADERAMKVSTDKKRSSKKLVSRSSSSKGAFTRKVCAMPTWLESWEREDTYAVLAVGCAVVSVAVAYSCYKQLS